MTAAVGDNRGMNGIGSKVWLITGSSRGLGRAFVHAALEAGHRVVATARDPSQLSDIVNGYGHRVRAVALDVTDEAQAQHAIDETIETFGGLDVLVNNAGYGNVCPVEDTPLADFRAQIETNLFGVIIMTKAALPYFREQRAGHIIQVTSIAGRIGPVGRAPYAAAKFGVEGFSESLYKEVGPLGIKVTIIEPGGFRTDFAGASTELREGRPEYDATVGAAVRFQRDYDGKQPGDPAKAAAVLLRIASLSDPPLRLLLGSDSYGAAEKAALQKLELDRKWKELSISTDYPSDDISAG
jgi:NAD(P)-dependent dehydrogenase (short-subunit alcohol dehydrogenase family)